jgi:alkylation response protein AidB-like acyl-CoA dehydrogenase
MRLEPDADALEFASGVRALLADAADSAALRTAWDAGASGEADGRVPGLWKRLAEVGVLGLTVPEWAGGSGMDLTAAVPVLVETGRAAVPEPVVEALAGASLLGAAGGPVAQVWLPRLAAGDALLGIGIMPGAGAGAGAGPGRRLVAGVDGADLWLLADDTGAVHAVSGSDVRVEAAASIDKGMRLGYVDWTPRDETRVLPPDNPARAAAYDVAVVAAAAQLVGLAEAMLDMSVRYAKQREQFGRPIGSFQAVKHQLADVYVGNAFALPVVYRASWSVAHDLPSRERDVSHAKLAASRAAGRAARAALQVHAGIGYTYEHDLHMWMKRTWSLTSLWGDDAMHRARVTAAVLGENPSSRVP